MYSENCGDKLDAFLDRTYHINGGFNNKDGMKMLNRRMEQIEVRFQSSLLIYIFLSRQLLFLQKFLDTRAACGIIYNHQ